MELPDTTALTVQEPIPAKVYLVAEHDFELHTNIAKKLFNGKWRFGKMGLIQFATVITNLWRAYKQDDPYARQYFYKVFESVEEAKNKIKGYEKILQEQMDSLRGFKINLYKSTQPHIEKLKFATPFPSMAAVLIEHVDYVARQIYTLRSIGLIPHEKLTPSKLFNEVQFVFSLPRKWKNTGLTTKDMRENNDKAKEAIRLFGEIPEEILNNEITLAFLPKIKSATHDKTISPNVV